MRKTPKAYLINYTIGEEQKTICIVHYSKKEAGDMFISWANHKALLDDIKSIAVVRARKNKKNAYLLTHEYIAKEQTTIEQMPMERGRK